jgi:hypothetical protein
LSTDAAQIGRLAIPVRRSRIILRDAVAVPVHVPETELSADAALIARLAIPDHRTSIIPRGAIAVLVHEPEKELSAGVALVGKRSKESQRGRIVAREKSSPRILKRPGGYRSSNADGKDEGGGSVERAGHIIPPIDAHKRRYLRPVEPKTSCRIAGRSQFP